MGAVRPASAWCHGLKRTVSMSGPTWARTDGQVGWSTRTSRPNLRDVAVVHRQTVEVEGQVDVPVGDVARHVQELPGHAQVDHEVGGATVC